jgi:hypothetical protein
MTLPMPDPPRLPTIAMNNSPTNRNEGTETYRLCKALGWTVPDKNSPWPGPYSVEECFAKAKQLDAYLSKRRQYQTTK